MWQLGPHSHMWSELRCNFFTFSFRNGVGDAAVERLKKRVMANAEIRVHRACSHSDISERLLVLVTVTDFHSFRINF